MSCFCKTTRRRTPPVTRSTVKQLFRLRHVSHRLSCPRRRPRLRPLNSHAHLAPQGIGPFPLSAGPCATCHALRFEEYPAARPRREEELLGTTSTPSGA